MSKSKYTITPEDAIKQHVLLVDEAIKLGFEKGRTHKLGTEYIAVSTSEILAVLKERGMKTIWGHEGGWDRYAEFTSDNPDHELFGKKLISLYAY